MEKELAEKAPSKKVKKDSDASSEEDQEEENKNPNKKAWADMTKKEQN